MKTFFGAIIMGLLFGCQDTSTKSDLDFKAELSDELSEVSGLAAEEDGMWAITDKPKAVVYSLDLKGKVQQTITVKNVKAEDVEAVTRDSNFVYIGDIGDNEGGRDGRQIIKVSKIAIGKEDNQQVDGEVITFRFSNETMVDQKKKNNYDCEAMLSYGDSLYLFTKRRTDFKTELFSLPKIPGDYVAQSIGIFDTQGLITDAAINTMNNEVAVTGYNKGHKYPFILLFKNFQGCNFFSGITERIELADKPWDWQMEGISYDNAGNLFFACEQTKEVKATLYVISRDKLVKLNKKK